jgi:glyoxylase-like metal-dependent hydrolase (beta-lactamase superfamily II)
MGASFRLGDTDIVLLDDGAGPFFDRREAAFPSATAEQWLDADAADPDAVGLGGEWLLRFRCFAIRLTDQRVILVDAGIGPADAPAAAWAPVPGRLPESLAEAGIAPGDVSTVVVTHLHTDHVGWAVVDGRPYFGNARYVLPRGDVEAVRQLNPALEGRLLEPLRAAGQLSTVDGDEPLAPGVEVVATPGHTPGHQSVLVTHGDERVLITGDLLVHALQLVHPDVGYTHESDQDLARESRLRQFRAGGVLATAHLSQAFVPLPVPPPPPPR